MSFNYLPRSKNQLADALATLSSMLKISKKIDLRLIKVETQDRQVYCSNVESESNGNPWYHDIKVFLRDGKANLTDKRTLRKLACHFFLNGEVLYKRSYDVILLRCVGSHEANKIMTRDTWGTIHTSYAHVHVSSKNSKTWVLLTKHGSWLFQACPKISSVSSIYG